MRITIDTKWIESLEEFDDETRLTLYESIFDYLQDKDITLPNGIRMMFSILKPQLDEEKNRRTRIEERNRLNGSKGGRPKSKTQQNPKKSKEPNGLLYNSEERSDALKKFDEWIKRNAPYVYANLSPLTEKEFESLKGKYTSKQIADTIEQIENRKDLRKKYTCLYRTLLNWLKNGNRTGNE
jgi:hypothetical protein